MILGETPQQKNEREKDRADRLHHAYKTGEYIDEFTTPLESIPLTADGEFDTERYLEERPKQLKAMAKATFNRLPKCLIRDQKGKIKLRKDIQMEPQNETQIIPSKPEQAYMVNQKEPPSQVLARAREAATALKGVIDAKQKKVIINGEVYLEFEDWSTLGSFYHIAGGAEDAVPVQIDGISGAKAIGYAKNMDSGLIISSAVAYCMKDEPNWEHKPWFQLASMSQTRAAAKALRNVLSRIVVLAGYKATPAEEMIDQNQDIKFPFGTHKGKSVMELTLGELQAELIFWNKLANDPKNKFAASNKKLVSAIEKQVELLQQEQVTEFEEKYQTNQAEQPKETMPATTKESGRPRPIVLEIKNMTKIKELILNEAKNQGQVGEERQELNNDEKNRLSNAIWNQLGHWPKNEEEVILCARQIQVSDIFELKFPEETEQ